MKLGASRGAEKGGSSPKLELQIGVPIGMTEATADTTARAKLAIT